MARLPIPGKDFDWGEILNNFLSIEHNSDGTQKTLPVKRGGTGATNAPDARANLGLGAGVYVQDSKPDNGDPHLWIQTGLGKDGSGMTFWIEDGK